MIVSNSGTLQVQADLPALSKCLKDIKLQLGDIQNELDSRPSTKPIHTQSPTDTQKLVTNIIKTSPRNTTNIKKTKSKSTASKSVHKSTKTKVLNKADSNWRTGAVQMIPNANAVYPEWWPNDETNENCYEIPQDEVTTDNTESETTEQIIQNAYNTCAPAVQHPHVYSQPIAFSVPKSQFGKDTDGNVVQLHVNLYPEYMQKCLDANAMDKVNNDEHQARNKTVNNKKKRKSKFTKKGKNSRSKSLTRCTESSQAKANGKRPQSSYLKANNRNIAPCLKHQKPRVGQRKRTKAQRRKSLPHKASKVPKYLQNVESRIKKELRKDRTRRNKRESEKQCLMQDIAKYGLNENENDQYYEEWKEQFGYDRISAADVTKPSVLTVADAMMHSEIIQAMNPSFTKEPTLVTGNESLFLDADLNDKTNSVYDRAIFNKENESSLANDSLNNMNFLSDLREWASG
eukprot:204453_1